MNKWQIEFYQLPNGGSPIRDWFQELNPRVQAKFTRVFELLTEYGILLGMPHVRSIKDSKLFEIRIEQNTDIYRIFYFAYTDQRFILLHGFQKKSQKTPKKEIKVAEARMSQFLTKE